MTPFVKMLEGFVLVAQGVALLLSLYTTLVRVALALPGILLSCFFGTLGCRRPKEIDKSCVFYKGTVYHVRRKPVHNDFTYPIRLALIDLDAMPPWFQKQAKDHWTAECVREKAGTQGCVKLLTSPVSCGYVQNPISVYYCYSLSNVLEKCIAEVTNTPWGGRVNFVFDPTGDTVSKSLHVSPFMDMQSQWTLKSEISDERLSLAVHVSHPDMGTFFDALMHVKRSPTAQFLEVCLEGAVYRYGFQPHRIAFWIYYQAWRLWRLGVPSFGYPDPKVTQENVRHSGTPLKFVSGEHFIWRDPAHFPWKP